MINIYGDLKDTLYTALAVEQGIFFCNRSNII